MSENLKQREENKRTQCWDALSRWKTIEQTIEWVDSQQAVPRSSRQACIKTEARLLAAMGPKKPAAGVAIIDNLSIEATRHHAVSD